MVIPLVITVTERPPPWATVRGWRELRRAIHEDAGEYWRTKIAPKHFEPSARNRYRYQPRKPGYRTRSAKQRRNNRPSFVAQAIGKGVKRGGTLVRARPEALTSDLIFTGLLRSTILDLSRTRGFPTRATVVTPKLPSYAPRRPRPGNTQPPVFDEATRLTNTERRELFRVLQKSFQANSRRLRRRHAARVRRIASKS